VVVRKNRTRSQGAQRLVEERVSFCYLTNDWDTQAAELVFSANGRCNQEHLVAQWTGGGRALRTPVDNLESNGAYLVLTALAWNLKAWGALTWPEEPGRWHARQRQEKRWVLGWALQTFAQRLRAAALSDRADGASAGVPAVVVEAVSAELLPVGVGAALRSGDLRKSESGCSEHPRLGTRWRRKDNRT
jgi:hypothetical protein